MTELHDKYNQFYDAQVHLKPTSKRLMFNKLKIFPPPDKLTVSWFRGRVKTVAPSTAQYDKTLILQVLTFLNRSKQAKEIRAVKLPKIEPSVTVKDLYTREELQRMFAVSLHLRDRAILQVLYESATRISELLSMTIENTTFNDDGTATIVVSGKTGTRSIPLLSSVPMLRDWMNHHPTGKGSMWVSFRSPHNPLPRPRVYNMVKGVLQKSEIKDKKNILHMFRHTRLTELVRLGISGQTLWKIAGWKSGKMELVYIHLSTADVENEVKTKVFGMDEDKERLEAIVRPLKCPRCDEMNEPSARYCSKCNMPISDDAIISALEQHEEKREKTVELEERIKYLETQLEAHQAMLTVAVETAKQEMADLRKFLQRLEKQEF